VTEVRLVDLAVIKQFSLAVRQEWAPADEVLSALEESRQAVIDALVADGVSVEDATADKRRVRGR
jgi:uncharacterized protein YggE